MIVDQFEELFTQTIDDAERFKFLDFLVAGQGSRAGDSLLSIVLTLRADFMGQVLSYGPFADGLQRGIQTLGPMSREEMRTAVVRPAESQGVIFEEGLADRILDDVGVGAGNLPLLEFCLAELWGWGGEGTLSHVAYEATGRVDGALSSHAEAVYEELDPQTQEGVKRLLLQLVQPGLGTEDTKRLVFRGELGAELWSFAQLMADPESRLVVVGRDESGRETDEIVHEAVIQRWSRLKEWIEGDRAFLTWRRGLQFSLEQWLDVNKDQGGLLRGVQLGKAQKWLKERDQDLATVEIDFILASTAYHEEERLQIEENKRYRQLAKILTHEEGWQKLNGADLNKAALSGTDLIKADLSGANLSGADLSGADLRKASMRGTNLLKANLSEANLSEANLSEANLSGADLSGADLEYALLRGTVINENTILDDKWRLVWEIVNEGVSGRDFSGADLRRSNLWGTNLSEVDLYEADLVGSFLREANLNKAYLSEANLSHVYLGGANLREVNLNKTNLSWAKLIHADLKKADLCEADLSGADLSWANLKGANLRRANLLRAKLEGANLENASFYQAKNVTPQQFSEATLLKGTIMPDGTSPKKWALSFFDEGTTNEETFNKLIELSGDDEEE